MIAGLCAQLFLVLVNLLVGQSIRNKVNHSGLYKVDGSLAHQHSLNLLLSEEAAIFY